MGIRLSIRRMLLGGKTHIGLKKSEELTIFR